MSYVILTADARYGNSPRIAAAERRGQEILLEQNELWAAQVDDADIGGPHEVVRIDLPQNPQDAPVPRLLRDTAGVLTATVDGWRRAAQLAGHGGTIGVLVGHGSSGRTSHGTQTAVFADLAPGEFLRVTVHLMQRYGEAMAHSGRMTPEYMALRDIEQAVRGNRIQRVDLLTCNLGAGNGGDLLGIFSRRWGAQVRGLRGFLHSDEVFDEGTGASRIAMFVVREEEMPESRPARAPRRFVDRIPDRGFWRE